jgi:hypothetical protein
MLRMGSLAVLLLICFPGCQSAHRSSGFMVQGNTVALPSGVPVRVGVATFSGDTSINVQATDRFASGLLSMGFDVVQRAHFESALAELGLSKGELLSEKTRTELGQQIGLEGIFVGNVTGESSILEVNSHVNIQLVEARTGRIIWTVTNKDPRAFTWSMSVKTSINHAIDHSLNILSADLDEMR